MSWLTEALGGPVLAWEMKRASRHKLWRYLSRGYCVWLFIQALALSGAVYSVPLDLQVDSLSRLEIFRARLATEMEFLNRYFALLLQFQLILVIALIPFFTAGSLGQEKERGTLFALFGTQLTSREILLGKLLGRLIPIIALVLTSLPVLVFLVAYTGRGLTPLILALVQEAIVAVAVGAVCLLFGIWIRRATDAILASYLFLVLAYFLLRVLANSVPEAYWLDPVENLQRLLNDGPGWALLAHLALWALLGACCLRVGWGRLRKVCVEQRDRRPSRRLWAFRPAIGNNPFRWRECHVIGLAPLPILRIVPRWLALLAVFTFSAAVAAMVANILAPGIINALWGIDPVWAYNQLRMKGNQIKDYLPFMGVAFILLACVLVGVRCGTSVAEEKRRNTWDDLLLTARSFREITNGKMWGVLQAIVPYIVAYALPVFLLAWVGGPGTLIIAGLWIILPCAIVYVAALMGIEMLRVPPDMDETRPEGAFWFEKEGESARRREGAEGLPPAP